MHGQYHISSMCSMDSDDDGNDDGNDDESDSSDDFIDHANTDYVLLYDHITHHGVLLC